MVYPQLPTDNLYKFVALAGLAIFIFAVGYAPAQLLELTIRVIDVQSSTEKLRLESNALNKDVDRLDKKKSSSHEDWLALREKALAIQQRAIDIEAMRKKTAVQIQSIEFYKWAIPVLGALSALMMYWGFWAWYVKVQRPQDIAARRNKDEPRPNPHFERPVVKPRLPVPHRLRHRSSAQAKR